MADADADWEFFTGCAGFVQRAGRLRIYWVEENPIRYNFFLRSGLPCCVRLAACSQHFLVNGAGGNIIRRRCE